MGEVHGVPEAHTLAHPTNIAFSGDTLYTANLGRWHIAAIDMDIGADILCTTLR